MIGDIVHNLLLLAIISILVFLMKKNDENKKLKCFLIGIKFCSLNAL